MLARVRRWLAGDLAPGVVLLVATAVALLWANSPLADSYSALWETALPHSAGQPHDVRHWVNDALMTVFFFAIGLEVKRELAVGALSHPRAAAVPALAAVGGAVVPALVFLAITWGGPAASGWGIPMATDPAFAVGVLALLVRGAPSGVRLLLLAIATVDDVLAVVVIAAGYTGGLDWPWLAAAAVACVVVAVVRRCGVTAIWPYLPLGVAVWYATLRSGVHPTLTGVALALLTPAGLVAGRDLLADLLRWVTPFSVFVAVPVFALANAGVRLDADSIAAAFGSRVTWAVLAALVVGKTVGVVGTIAAVTASRVGRLPDGITPRHLLGLGLVCGLGFTVSLFVTELAYQDPALIAHAKIGVLASALICSAAAALVLATGRAAGNPTGPPISAQLGQHSE
jgi:NhaA family Na+:H+ antiporter